MVMLLAFGVIYAQDDTPLPQGKIVRINNNTNNINAKVQIQDKNNQVHEYSVEAGKNVNQDIQEGFNLIPRSSRFIVEISSAVNPEVRCGKTIYLSKSNPVQINCENVHIKDNNKIEADLYVFHEGDALIIELVNRSASPKTIKN